jgi:hypothetical protein
MLRNLHNDTILGLVCKGTVCSRVAEPPNIVRHVHKQMVLGKHVTSNLFIQSKVPNTTVEQLRVYMWFKHPAIGAANSVIPLQKFPCCKHHTPLCTHSECRGHPTQTRMLTSSIFRACHKKGSISNSGGANYLEGLPQHRV